MDIRKKLEDEIARKRKLIEDSQIILEKIPGHLRQSQQLAIDIYKRELGVLESELTKLEENSKITNV